MTFFPDKVLLHYEKNFNFIDIALDFMTNSKPSLMRGGDL